MPLRLKMKLNKICFSVQFSVQNSLLLWKKRAWFFTTYDPKKNNYLFYSIRSCPQCKILLILCYLKASLDTISWLYLFTYWFFPCFSFLCINLYFQMISFLLCEEFSLTSLVLQVCWQQIPSSFVYPSLYFIFILKDIFT